MRWTRASGRLGLRQKAVLRALASGPKTSKALATSAGSDRATIRRLEERGYVTTREVERRRAPAVTSVGATSDGVELNPAQRAAVRAIGESLDGGRRRLAPPWRHRVGQDRGLPRGRPRRARPREGRDRPRPRDRVDAADDEPLPAAVRRPRGAAAFEDVRGRPLRRVAAPQERGCEDRRGPALGGLRTGRRARPGRDRRGARFVLQAGVGPPLRRPRGRGPPRRACRGGSRRGLGHSATGELELDAAASPARPGGRAPAAAGRGRGHARRRQGVPRPRGRCTPGRSRRSPTSSARAERRSS